MMLQLNPSLTNNPIESVRAQMPALGCVVVGRIFNSNAGPVGSPWMRPLAFGHHEDRTPTHGYAATREGAMAAFAKSWRRE
jgi:hypothetical protein